MDVLTHLMALLAGTALGVMFMALFQINRLPDDDDDDDDKRCRPTSTTWAR